MPHSFLLGRNAVAARLIRLGLLLALGACHGKVEKASKPDLTYPSNPSALSNEQLYQAYCGGCHLLPDPADIPKPIWENQVLPEMGARLGYQHDGFNPFARNSMRENIYVRKSGVYPSQSLIDSSSWQALFQYVLRQAPDEIPVDTTRENRNQALYQFRARPISIQRQGLPAITSINFDSASYHFLIGNAMGESFVWNDTAMVLPVRASSAIVDHDDHNDQSYLTAMGIMNPSEMAKGSILAQRAGKTDTIISGLHRPVFTQVVDLNGDGIEEILIAEFGHHTGALSMLVGDKEEYEKQTLLPLPGVVKFEVADLDADGSLDLVVLAGQGREGIYIFYQKGNLQFETDHVIQLPPHYGSSWFNMIDFNHDGHPDILLVNGDNADYSIFPKPYHGVRLYLNDGENQFNQVWFYPIYGATRSVVDDFDADNDLDIVVTAYFPHQLGESSEGLVYLQCENEVSFEFSQYTYSDSNQGRWLVMEKGDPDLDGDQDLLIGSFLFGPLKDRSFSPPDLLYLENTTIE